jgi:hypothetical protein
MSRNYKKNKNITIPLPRDSETLQKLIADAADCNMSDKIGVFAGIRLAEYYKARQEGRILPEGAGYHSAALFPQAWPASTTAVPSASLSRNGYQHATSSSGPSAAELERLKDRPEIIEAAEADELEEDDLAFFLDDEEDEEEED